MDNLGHTRLGLGDPNDNLYDLAHCRLPGASTSCFQIWKKSSADQCRASDIPREEVEHHPYASNESLLFAASRINQVLLSETNHVMPHFLDNLLRYLH